MYMIKNLRIIKGLFVFVFVFGVIVCLGLISEYFYVKENNVMYVFVNSLGEIVKLNDNIVRIDLKKGIDYSVDKNGVVILKDVKIGKKEILLLIVKDKNGKNVMLIYFEKDGKLGFYV